MIKNNHLQKANYQQQLKHNIIQLFTSYIRSIMCNIVIIFLLKIYFIQEKLYFSIIFFIIIELHII